MSRKSKLTIKTDPNAFDNVSNEGIDKNLRQIFISPAKDSQRSSISKQIRPSYKPLKEKSLKNMEGLPPRAAPFRRDSHNQSRNDTRIYSDHKRFPNELKKTQKQYEERMKNIEHQLQLEKKEKGRLQQLNGVNLTKIKKLIQDVSKLTMEKSRLEELRSTLQFRVEQSQNQLKAAWSTIQNLNKTIQQMKNSQVYSNIKTLQTQVHTLQQKNNRLTKQYQQIIKVNKTLKQDLDNKKDSTEESSDLTESNKVEGKMFYDFQINRLKGELTKNKSEREKQLEFSLEVLEKKLYQKEAEIKKLSIQLNFIDRKRFASIDEVREKKDKEIKQLKTNLIKTVKDLKQAKETIQQNQKKAAKKSIPCPIRKIKSHKNIGFTSESEVTFELSADA